METPTNSEYKVIEFNINDLSGSMRLDKYLSICMPDYSRSFLKNLIDDGKILVNGNTTKGKFNVTNGLRITVNIPKMDNSVLLPEDILLDILYEDDDVILINKPKGMVVHPATGHFSGTLVNALLYHCNGNLSSIDEERPGIVHRIDKDTTGVIIACKNNDSHLFIAKQLEEHTINRRYKAIVYGKLEGSGIIDSPVGRSSKDRKKIAVVEGGKRAITHYTVLKNFNSANASYSYIECKLETGRTHQIRVHMSSINHPLLGDTVYGPSKVPFKLRGQVLHAEVLGFIHPRTHNYMEFSAPLPEYFTKLLKTLDTLI